MKTDEDLRADPNFFNDPSGCTAVVTLATSDGRLICVCCFQAFEIED
jgi:protein phosphatase 2C family protein 2/3